MVFRDPVKLNYYRNRSPPRSNEEFRASQKGQRDLESNPCGKAPDSLRIATQLTKNQSLARGNK